MKICNIYILANLVLASLLYIVIIGCSTDNLKPTSVSNIVVEKKVAVACEVPKIDCNFKGELFEPTVKLLECIKLQKEVIRICTETK